MTRRQRRARARLPLPKSLYWFLVLALTVGGLWLGRRPDIVGGARAIDGDSLVVGGVEMRLKGIDAPEGRQTCTREGRSWPCGEAARAHLVRLAAAGSLRCTDHGSDQHDRKLATCFAGGQNLNQAMVRDGYAVAYGAYEEDEREARAQRRGLWAGAFERPRDWRDKHMR